MAGTVSLRCCSAWQVEAWWCPFYSAGGSGTWPDRSRDVLATFQTSSRARPWRRWPSSPRCVRSSRPGSLEPTHARQAFEDLAVVISELGANAVRGTPGGTRCRPPRRRGSTTSAEGARWCSRWPTTSRSFRLSPTPTGTSRTRCAPAAGGSCSCPPSSTTCTSRSRATCSSSAARRPSGAAPGVPGCAGARPGISARS